MDLNAEKVALLRELLELMLADKPIGFPEVTPFRLAHESQRGIIDELVSKGLIQHTGTARYALTLSGLRACNDTNATNVLRSCNDILRILQDAYRAEPTKTVTPDDIAARAVISPLMISRFLFLLSERPFWRGLNRDSATGEVTGVLPLEGVLDLKPLPLSLVEDAPRVAGALTSVAVNGFLSWNTVHVPLRRLNVLIGVNGAGKSNFLKLLDMLRSMAFGELRDWTRKAGGADSILHGGVKHTERITGQLIYEDRGFRVEYSFTIGSAAPDDLTIEREEQKFSRGGFEGALSPMYGNELGAAPGHGEDGMLTRVLRQVRFFHFHDTSATSPMRQLHSRVRNERLDPDAANLASFLRRLREDSPMHYERIVGEVKKTVPDFTDFLLAPNDPEPRNVMLTWRGQYSDYDMGPHQLSDGSLRAIALITLLLQPESSLPPIILLDEPELGLHPHAVGQIGALLKEASHRCQLIVSTQSSAILREMEPEDVLVVSREGAASGIKRLSREELAEWLDEFEGDLSQLFEMNVIAGVGG